MTTKAERKPEAFAKRFKRGSVAVRLDYRDHTKNTFLVYGRALESGKLGVVIITDFADAPLPVEFELILFESEQDLDLHRTEHWDRGEASYMGENNPKFFEHQYIGHTGMVFTDPPVGESFVRIGFAIGLINGRLDKYTGEEKDILESISKGLTAGAMGRAWAAGKYGFHGSL